MGMAWMDRQRKQIKTRQAMARLRGKGRMVCSMETCNVDAQSRTAPHERADATREWPSFLLSNCWNIHDFECRRRYPCIGLSGQPATPRRQLSLLVRKVRTTGSLRTPVRSLSERSQAGDGLSYGNGGEREMDKMQCHWSSNAQSGPKLILPVPSSSSRPTNPC